MTKHFRLTILYCVKGQLIIALVIQINKVYYKHSIKLNRKNKNINELLSLILHRKALHAENFLVREEENTIL